MLLRALVSLAQRTFQEILAVIFPVFDPLILFRPKPERFLPPSCHAWKKTKQNLLKNCIALWALCTQRCLHVEILPPSVIVLRQ